ncbi:MAG TPA: DMT family transporter [Gemmatimonadales bacterium]|nr:DMT family transporter [Gemmatimonadales bacterium]
MKTPREFTAHLALIAAQVSFGLFPVFGTLIFRPGGLTPLGVAVWRLGAGAVLLLLLALAVHGRRVIPARSDLGRFALAAWLGVGLNQAFFLEGLARSTPINATLVMCLIPVFTFGIAAAVRQEPFSGRRLAGVLIALAGLLPLLFEHGLHLGRYGLGNLLMTGNALCYSAYLVVAKPLAPRYPPLVVIAWAYVLSLPLVPYFAWGEHLLPATGNAGAWWALAYIVAFPTVLAYLFNMFALARVRASTAAVYVYAQPLVAVFASGLVFGEQISGTMLLAAVGLFVGVWLVTRAVRSDQTDAQSLRRVAVGQ